MSKVLVMGGSRGVGRAICQALAAEDHQVRSMSRSGDAGLKENDRIEAFRGDALDGADTERALDGVDTVVQALGVKASLAMVTSPVTLFSEATRVLLPAMEKIGVNRLIAVTGFGAGDSSAYINPLQRLPFRVVLGRAYDDKTTQEYLIEKSAIDWLIVRPGVLTNGARTDRYRILMKPHEWRNGIISRADVADFIARQCSKETLGRRKPVLIRCLL
ncbi:MAG: NAD(P)-binding oxidoreductase [Pseudomonadota bacterium]